MKRTIILYTIIITVLLLSGCAGNIPKDSTNNNSGNSNSPASDSSTPSATPELSQDNTQGNPEDSTQDTPQDNGQNQAPATDQTIDQAIPSSNDGAMISEEKARSIALSHAGLTEEQVTFIKSGIDRDDGRTYYDVEFYGQDQKEYDYEIDPYTGEILDYDFDAEYYNQSSAPSQDSAISEDDAKQIVLEQVPGATLPAIREFHYDYDNGRLQYEGKLFYNQTEYEFEIDGYSGEILEWDVEPLYCDVP